MDRNEDMFEVIPNSQQMVSQARYSSQRSIIARTQSVLAVKRQPKNYFENVLVKCSVGLETMECYVLSKTFKFPCSCSYRFLDWFVWFFQHAITWTLWPKSEICSKAATISRTTLRISLAASMMLWKRICHWPNYLAVANWVCGVWIAFINRKKAW